MAHILNVLFATGDSTQPQAVTSGLDLLHALADGIIAASLFLIPAALLVIYLRRGERRASDQVLLILFMLLLTSSGLTHFASALFGPGHDVVDILTAFSALLALTAAIVIWRLTPELVRRPSRDRLQSEIAAHLRTLEELKETRQQLEQRVEARTKELAEAKQRFEIALRGSPIMVFTQDRDMRFTWVHNPPSGIDPACLLGKTDAEILSPEAAASFTAAKRRAIETGESQTIETNFELSGRRRSYYLLTEALHDDKGDAIGTTSVAVEITERKEAENQLRLLLRELTHRSKNLLAVIQAIARQTAARTKTIDDFLDRFGARLVAIGCSQDLLVADNWHGASLRTLVEQQLNMHTADRSDSQIVIDGEDVMLKPEAVQNLGLALHELATNAQKYGALSSGRGSVRIHWQFCESDQLKLTWEERGGPPVSTPERSGFGRAMIESVVGKALEGEVKLSFPAKGVRCVIMIPETQVASRG
ncbi:sensor histidine kinase [Methyloceanibacter sp.]|uniref:sensor histidine kinase n=1 Tax=Methyloceanibacter sp. TaxID=1965321 RepID=UPI003D6D3A7D